MKRYFIWIIAIFICLGGAGFTSGAAQEYSRAVEFAKAGQSHFAFMHYNEVLRNYPESKYREQALFAAGEYYFKISNFQEATAAFKAFLKEYTDSKGRLYALAYLLSIMQKDKNTLAVEDLEKQIIDLQRVSFVFREAKEITYRSPLYQNYKTVIYIDKIEFYVEGKIFAKVSY